MHAPGKAHIVRVVVQHHHAQRMLGAEALVGNAALDQRPAQMVKVAAAHEHGAMLRGQLLLYGLAEAPEAAQAAAKAHQLMPICERQALFPGQRADRSVDIQHHRCWLHHALSLHWRSLSNRPEKRRPNARSKGLRMKTRCCVMVKLAPSWALTSGSVQPAT